MAPPVMRDLVLDALRTFREPANIRQVWDHPYLRCQPEREVVKAFWELVHAGLVVWDSKRNYVIAGERAA